MESDGIVAIQLACMGTHNHMKIEELIVYSRITYIYVYPEFETNIED